MAGFSTDGDRRVIPRWRTFDQTLRFGELNSGIAPRPQLQVTTDFLAPKLRDWLECKTAGHASDLVGAALTLGREGEVVEAAQFLLQDELNASPWARELARGALRAPDSAEIAPSPEALEKATLHSRVRTFRHLLRTEPKDPITWVELSRTYAILGLREQAERSMTIALQLATDNRFVLRSASRLWVHLDDPEKAHDIIGRADRTRYDPWLLAAEVAVGSINEKTPRFVKAARRMLSGGQFSPVHISELASAVATLELGSGNVRKSKKLFGQSLEQPTENSIAQAAWASRQNNAIQFEDEQLKLCNAFEAETWIHFQKGQWHQAVEQCRLWQYDQPFSSRPGVHGSYMSAIALEDYATSAWFARQGLRANPSDFMLMNNLAFALINRGGRGDIEEAGQVLSRAGYLQLSNQNRLVLHATQGFLAFRSGDVVSGRKLYSDARLEARNMRDDRLLALASVFHAMEEVSQKTSSSDSVSSEAFQALRRVPKDPVLKVLEGKLTRMSPPENKNTKYRP